MQYPHEREERKSIYAALIDSAHSDLFVKSVAVLFVGVFVIAAAIADSAWVNHSATATPISWLSFWTAVVFALAGFLFVLPKFFASHRSKKLWGIKRAFVIRTSFPSLLIGMVVCWVIGLQGPQQLPFVACMMGLFYALAIFSISGFNMPVVKYYTVTVSVLSLSLIVLALRHQGPSLLTHHDLANLFIILSVGFPSLIFGAWKTFIKPS